MRGAVEKVRPGITLAEVEVEVLCRLLDSGLPPGVPARLDSHAVREATVACLAARGLVGCGGGGAAPTLEVHDAVARTLRLVAGCRDARPCDGETLAVGEEGSVFVRRGDLAVVRFEPVCKPSPLDVGT